MARVVVVSCDHDPIVRTLYAYANAFIGSSSPGDVLHFHNARDQEILDAVAASEIRGIFVFLHGKKRPPGVINQNLIFDEGAEALFNNRIFCGTCYSLNAFSIIVVRNYGTVIGYKGELWVPLKSGRANEMAQALLVVHETLRENGNAKQAAENAASTYRAVADKWMSEGTIEGQVFAAFAITNSERIGVKGNEGATSKLRIGSSIGEQHEKAENNGQCHRRAAIFSCTEKRQHAQTTSEFRKAVLHQLSIWANEAPQEEVIAPASDASKALTRADLHDHVKKRTNLGKKLVSSWMNAALMSVMTAKK